MRFKKQLTREQALQKLKHFCGYQERCHSEVKEKAYSLGLRKTDVEELLSILIQDNYLSEERFAVAFARGKFRMNEWGRVKIESELKKKKISNYCIGKAMKQIHENDYLQLLKKLAEKKFASLKNEQYLLRKKKITDYLLQKGFEWELVKKETEA
ncbi:MAG: RecX family transcriptional regulator [Bacteroidetes bacterium]|nr:RecX family transcriptional regulator [Bacteroidota bacterium]MBS1929832.1 RecX family transcriptional regulator [Bacteroidota bacterium]